MRKIEILDCTLRDGGYINNWEFGKDNILKIFESLQKTNVDYIECGFVNNLQYTYNDNITIFKDFQELEQILLNSKDKEITLMMLINDFDIESLPICKSDKWSIRLSFHKQELNKAVEYGMKIKEKGYKLFFQPTVIMNYQYNEIIHMLDICNNILKPDVVGIVDTIGEMNLDDIKRVTEIFNEHLDKNIKLLFHGHNTLQLAFCNAIVFINNSKARDIIIDSTVLGMGRDAGNVCTELIADYLNSNYNLNYNLKHIMNLIDKVMLNMYLRYNWGYSPYYMLNAKTKIHPKYGKFFRANIKDINLIKLESMLNAVPECKRYEFDIKTANMILNKFFNGGVINESCRSRSNEIK